METMVIEELWEFCIKCMMVETKFCAFREQMLIHSYYIYISPPRRILRDREDEENQGVRLIH